MTPHELEQGRALLDNWHRPIGYSMHGMGTTTAVWSEEARKHLDEWLRKHAAELLADSAALAETRAMIEQVNDVRLEAGQRIVRLEGELREERAHADRLAETGYAVAVMARDLAEYMVRWDKRDLAKMFPQHVGAGAAFMHEHSAHAARRKEADNAAASE